MEDFRESAFVCVSETRVCIARLKSIAQANSIHIEQGRHAIRQSTATLYEVERLLRLTLR